MKDTYKVNILRNKSLTYMLPLVDAELKLDFDNYLLNCYVSFEKNDETFCLMYSWSSNPAFLKYEGKLMSHPMYIGHADFGEKVVYKFQLTHVMKLERQLFLEGRYKEFSEKHKKTILDYIKSKGFNNYSRINKILDKNDELKSDAPDSIAECVSDQVSILIINRENIFDESNIETSPREKGSF